MTTAYCQLYNDVTGILRDNVRFSDSLHSLGAERNNTGTIDFALDNLVMDNAYSGLKKRFEILFENAGDLTQFNVYMQLGLDGNQDMSLIASGNTGADLVIVDIMEIEFAGWSGIAALNDRIIIITDSHMSIDNAESIINDVESEIDSRLREEILITEDEGTIPTDLYFVLHNPPVPRQIKTVAAYKAAYLIVNDVFRAVRSIQGISGKEENKNATDSIIADRWLRRSNEVFEHFIYMCKIRGGTIPRWSSVGPIQRSVGVYDELQGVSETEQDSDYTTYSSNDDPSLSIEKLLRNTGIDPSLIE